MRGAGRIAHSSFVCKSGLRACDALWSRSSEKAGWSSSSSFSSSSSKGRGVENENENENEDEDEDEDEIALLLNTRKVQHTL